MIMDEDAIWASGTQIKWNNGVGSMERIAISEIQILASYIIRRIEIFKKREG